jgi:hypothetical protein
MTSEVLTRLLRRWDGQTTSNEPVDHESRPDQSEEIAQLHFAVMSNRRISLAMGILMRDQNIDENEAFMHLRRMSQDSNRKLRDIAEDVIDHRRLPPGPRRGERLKS